MIKLKTIIKINFLNEMKSYKKRYKLFMLILDAWWSKRKKTHKRTV